MGNILKLTLSRGPFEVMETGEKLKEYREKSKWIKSRLQHPDGSDKIYSSVQFTNGYGSKCPRFECVYLGYTVAETDFTIGPYSNGLEVSVKRGDFIINLGPKI